MLILVASCGPLRIERGAKRQSPFPFSIRPTRCVFSKTDQVLSYRVNSEQLTLFSLAPQVEIKRDQYKQLIQRGLGSSRRPSNFLLASLSQTGAALP